MSTTVSVLRPRKSNLTRPACSTSDDGRGALALADGAATIRSEWFGPGANHLSVALDERVSVVLVYESPQWSATEKERRRKKAKDL